MFVVTDGTRTGRDVLADALTQDWIDTPATVRRAELAAAERTLREAVRGPIPRLDIRELLETEHELRRKIERYETARSETRQRLTEIEPRHGRLAQELADDQHRLTAAQAVLDRHDRRFHRWGHAAEITGARKTVDVLEDAISYRKHRLDQLSAEIDQLRTRARDLDRRRPDRARWTTELDETRGHIADDLAARRHYAHRSPIAARELGPRPTHGRDAALWDGAAAQIDQHHAAFSRDEPSRLDWFHRQYDSAYATSRHRTDHAIDQLDEALHPGRHRQRGHELDLGISL